MTKSKVRLVNYRRQSKLNAENRTGNIRQSYIWGVCNDSYMYQLAFAGIITNVKQYLKCSMKEVSMEIAYLSPEMLSKSPYTYIDMGCIFRCL